MRFIKRCIDAVRQGIIDWYTLKYSGSAPSPEATLIVYKDHTKCSKCGGCQIGIDPMRCQDIIEGRFGGYRPGCGATFINRTTPYFGQTGWEDLRVSPALPMISWINYEASKPPRPVTS